MKIAIIDTGITKEDCENYEIKHFSLSNEGLVNIYQPPIDKHGTECFKEIVTNFHNNKKFQIVSFNILKERGRLEVKNIIKSMEKAIEENVDIINISLGVMSFSQELYDVCERAVNNNIVVVSASSHTNITLFPADFNNVICVKVDQSQSERIKLVNASTISMNMRDFIINEGDKQFDFSSSSLACARFCGIICNDLDVNPINDKYKILFHKYKISLYSDDDSSNDEILEGNDLQEILRNNRVAVVVFPDHILNKLDQKFFNKNIVAYYDHAKCGFYNLSENKPTNNFELILIINASGNELEFPNYVQEKYKDCEIICIGKFSNIDGNKYFQKYETYKSSTLSVIDRPVIAVTSLCSGLNKWDVQLSLLKKLKEDGLEVGTIANNPIGLLYEMNIFNFPNELKFPDIVYSINKFMYLCEINTDVDAWLINIGGGTCEFNQLNTYNFGKLLDAYLSSANIDIILMCINPSIDINFLQLQLAYLYKHGVKKIFLILSHNDIDTATTDHKDGLQTYYIDEQKYGEALDYFKKNVDETVFELTDIENGNLYEAIINALI